MTVSQKEKGIPTPVDERQETRPKVKKPELPVLPVEPGVSFKIMGYEDRAGRSRP